MVKAMAKRKKTAKSEKLWGGRFDAGTDSSVEKFTASVKFDRNLASFDVRQSMAHARMLCDCGLISKKDFNAIKRGLGEIRKEIEAGSFEFSEALEDVHMNIEARLAELIGSPAGKLHTARSRNDQVVTDLKLYLKDSIDRISDTIRSVQGALVDRAEEHAGSLMPGYTHLQRAQPVPLGHHLMAYFFMLERDHGRFSDCARRMDTLPLGAGALAGSALPTDPKAVARELGFSAVADNSIDAVSDRDFLIEYLSACTILMNHLGRCCEEFVVWMSSEFGFVSFPDELCTGSSIMPQKKNPDVAELIRGKNGRVAGALVSLVVTLKALPMSYNRDLQEDKEPAFDATGTVIASLELYGKLVAGAKFHEDRMAEAAAAGFLNAVDLTDYMVKKGIPFRESHGIAGRLVRRAIEKNCEFAGLRLEDFKAESEVFENDVYKVLDPGSGMKKRKGPGAASPAEVRRQVRKAKKILDRQGK